MGDNRTDLPEGTDTIIAGASSTDDAGNAGTTENQLVTETKTPATRRPTDKLRERLRDGGERLSNEATDRARGLVGQGPRTLCRSFGERQQAGRRHCRRPR